jgi:hypothetical protein
MSDKSKSPTDEEALDPVSFFDPAIHNAVTGMIYLGKHTKTVKFVGHTFVMETIRPHMKFAIGQAMQDHRNTITEPQVWAAMHVGVALTSIDGNTKFSPPIGTDEVEFVRQRFRYVTDETGWWQPVIDYLFAEYSTMEIETTQAIAELHSLAQAGKAISSPSPGFWIKTEPSVEETNEDGPSSESSS